MRRLLLFCLTAGLLLAADPWTDHDVMQPEQLAKDVKTPLVIHVGFDVLYRASRITGTPYAGPASAPKGIEALKKAVTGQPLDREIVLYCGCCPMDHCPNIRPAFAALHAMGYTNVKILSLPTNFKTDWIDKGYPTDHRLEQ
jgi:hypothetical protein